MESSKQNINNPNERPRLREVKMTSRQQQQQQQNNNKRLGLAPSASASDDAKTNTDQQQQQQQRQPKQRPAAAKLIKKAHVRFDDYLDLNEENMRRSCKRLMNRLYCEPGQQAPGQPAPLPSSAAECNQQQQQQPLDLMTMNQSPDFVGEKQPIRKSYLRSQYERRQERQMMNLVMKNMKKMQQQQQFEEEQQQEANKLSNADERSTICNHQLPAGAKVSHEPLDATASPPKPTGEEQEDLVVKSHELSKRRFFEKLERRESMRNNLIVGGGGLRHSGQGRRIEEQNETVLPNENAKGDQSENIKSANCEAAGKQQAEKMIPNDELMLLKLYQTLTSAAENPTATTTTTMMESQTDLLRSRDTCAERRRRPPSGQRLPSLEQQIEAATQLAAAASSSCVDSIVRTNELIGFRTQLPTSEQQRQQNKPISRDDETELNVTAHCAGQLDCQANSNNNNNNNETRPPPLIEFSRRQNGSKAQSCCPTSEQQEAAVIMEKFTRSAAAESASSGRLAANGNDSSGKELHRDEFERIPTSNGNKKEVVLSSGTNESEFEIKISPSQLLLMGENCKNSSSTSSPSSSAAAAAFEPQRISACGAELSVASQLIVKPMLADGAESRTARVQLIQFEESANLNIENHPNDKNNQLCGRQATTPSEFAANKTIDESQADHANLMNINSNECEPIDDKNLVGSQSNVNLNSYDATANQVAPQTTASEQPATTIIANANKKVQLREINAEARSAAAAEDQEERREKTMEPAGGSSSPSSCSALSSERQNNNIDVAEIKQNINPAPQREEQTDSNTTEMLQKQSEGTTTSSGRMIKNTMPTLRPEEEDSPTHPVAELQSNIEEARGEKSSTAQEQVALLALAATAPQQVHSATNDCDSANLNLPAAAAASDATAANLDKTQLSVSLAKTEAAAAKSLITPPATSRCNNVAAANEQRIRDVLPEANHDEDAPASEHRASCRLTTFEHEHSGRAQQAAAVVVGAPTASKLSAATLDADKEDESSGQLGTGDEQVEKCERRRADGAGPSSGENDQLANRAKYANPRELLGGGNKVKPAEDHECSRRKQLARERDDDQPTTSTATENSHLINCGNVACEPRNQLARSSSPFEDDKEQPNCESPVIGGGGGAYGSHGKHGQLLQPSSSLSSRATTTAESKAKFGCHFDEREKSDPGKSSPVVVVVGLEEDRGSSCSSSGFGASCSGATTSSSSSTSDSNSIKEKKIQSQQQQPGYSNVLDSYPRRFAYKRFEGHADDVDCFYDTIKEPHDRFQRHFCGHHVVSGDFCSLANPQENNNSNSKLVGPDESYPRTPSSSSPRSSWSLMIENVGYASNSQVSQSQAAPNSSCHYANLAPFQAAVEYATVRSAASKNSADEFSQVGAASKPSSSGSNGYSSSSSSSTSGGFSRLQPVSRLTRTTAENNVQSFNSLPAAGLDIYRADEDDAHCTPPESKSADQQQQQARVAKSSSLLKKFGSLVSKAFATGGSNGNQMAKSNDTTQAKEAAPTVKADERQQLMRPLDSIEAQADQINANGRRRAELEAQTKPSLVGHVDGSSEQSNTRSGDSSELATDAKLVGGADLVILPTKNNQTSPQAFNQPTATTATRRTRGKSGENSIHHHHHQQQQHHKQRKPMDDNKFDAECRRSARTRVERRTRRESHLNGRAGELVSFMSHSLSSLSSLSSSCAQSARFYSSLIAAPVERTTRISPNDYDEFREKLPRNSRRRLTLGGSPPSSASLSRRASSLSEELESLMSSDLIAIRTKADKFRDNKKEFNQTQQQQQHCAVPPAEHWGANSTTTNSQQQPPRNVQVDRRRIDIDCVSPTTDVSSLALEGRQQSANKHKSRSLLRWFSSTTTNDEPKRHDERRRRRERDQQRTIGTSHGTGIDSLKVSRSTAVGDDDEQLAASVQPMSGFWTLNGRKKEEKIYEIIEGSEPRDKTKRTRKLPVGGPTSLNVIYATPTNCKSSRQPKLEEQPDRYDTTDSNRCQSLNLVRNYVKRRQQTADSKQRKPSCCHHRSHHNHHRNSSCNCLISGGHSKHCKRSHNDHDQGHAHLSLTSPGLAKTKRCAKGAAAAATTSSCSSLNNYENVVPPKSHQHRRQRHQSTSCSCCCSKCAKGDGAKSSQQQVWGQLIKINKSDGSQVIELQRAQGRSWGFFVARGAINNVKGIFISRMHDAIAVDSLAGLMSIGDRILSIDGHPIGPDYDLLRVNQLISNKSKISLKVKPFKG